MTWGVVVTESGKRSTFKWFGYVERMHDVRLVKIIYGNEVEANRVRGRQLAFL